jgi:preprotein translocase subunit SecD
MHPLLRAWPMLLALAIAFASPTRGEDLTAGAGLDGNLTQWRPEATRAIRAGRETSPRGHPVAMADALASLERQGGLRLVLQIDQAIARKDLLEDLRGEVRRAFRELRIGYAGGLAIREDAIEVQIEPGDADRALAALAKMLSFQAPWLEPEYRVARTGDRSIRVAPTEAAVDNRLHVALRRTATIIRGRIAEAGFDSTSGVWPDGSERIIVLLPGVHDVKRLGNSMPFLAKPAFRLADGPRTRSDTPAEAPPSDAELLPAEGAMAFLVEKQIVMNGLGIAEARAALDGRTGEPIVLLRCNIDGARRLARVTQANVGRRLAMLLDDKVLSVPVIGEPIQGGLARLSGNYTIEQAENLAELLGFGVLPIPASIVEQHVIDAGLPSIAK